MIIIPDPQVYKVENEAPADAVTLMVSVIYKETFCANSSQEFFFVFLLLPSSSFFSETEHYICSTVSSVIGLRSRWSNAL